jgi:hypothetical protein
MGAQWKASKLVDLPWCNTCNLPIYPGELAVFYNRGLDTVDVRHQACKPLPPAPAAR